MRPRVIGLFGEAGSGKDTVADFIIATWPGYRKRAFAYPLKRAVENLFLLTPAQTEGTIQAKATAIPYWDNCTTRQILQFVGTDLLRNQIGQIMPQIGDSIFIKNFDKWLSEQPDQDKIIVPDVRFQNEVDYIHSIGGIVIRLNRDQQADIGGIAVHPSENHKRIVDIDYVIDNTGTLTDLYAGVTYILEGII